MWTINNHIVISENKLIKLPFSEYVIGEPHLSINPNNENHLLLGAMIWSTKVKGEISCISAVSFDGGINWKYHQFSDKRAGDPWSVITPNGEAVFAFLGKTPPIPKMPSVKNAFFCCAK